MRGNLKNLFEIMKVIKNYKREFLVIDDVFVSIYSLSDDSDDFGFVVSIDTCMKDTPFINGVYFDSKTLYDTMNTFIGDVEKQRKVDKLKPAAVSFYYEITPLEDEVILTLHADIAEGSYFMPEKIKLSYGSLDSKMNTQQYFERACQLLKPTVSTYELTPEDLVEMLDAGISEYYTVNHHGQDVKFPVMNSMFKRKGFDSIEISIRDTISDDVFQYNVYLVKNDIREVLSAYIINF